MIGFGGLMNSCCWVWLESMIGVGWYSNNFIKCLFLYIGIWLRTTSCPVSYATKLVWHIYTSDGEFMPSSYPLFLAVDRSFDIMGWSLFKGTSLGDNLFFKSWYSPSCIRSRCWVVVAPKSLIANNPMYASVTFFSSEMVFLVYLYLILVLANLLSNTSIFVPILLNCLLVKK